MTVRIEDHLPAPYASASRASKQGQDWFKRLTWVALALLVVASAGGLVAAEWGGWLSLIAFLGSIVLTALAVYRKTEQDWYDGRAAAESIKSLTFKYAVGGEPFGIVTEHPDRRFTDAIARLTSELKQLGSAVKSSDTAPALDRLRDLRATPLATRQAAYREQRLEDQASWYVTRAGEHRSTARRWRVVMFASQLLGATGAALKGLGLIEVDALSLLATIAAAAAGWIAAGDYIETARAYDFAAIELQQALETFGSVNDEKEWARYVADCEQAMSREHTMWLARRRGP